MRPALLFILLVVGMACFAPRAARGAFPDYPLTNGVIYSNTLFMQLWSGMVERSRAVNITTGLDYVRSYSLFVGYTNTSYAETNVSGGVTTVYSRIDPWPSYATYTLTNQWTPYDFNTTTVNEIIVPNVRASDLSDLDNRLFALVEAPPAGFAWVDTTLADTDGTFNGFCAIPSNTLQLVANLTRTGLFSRLGIGLVTNTVVIAGPITSRVWSAHFTDFAPAAGTNGYPIWESANRPTNWAYVLTGFSDTNVNGLFSYIGDGCDDSGFDVAYKKYSGGGTAIIGSYLGWCTAGVVDYASSYLWNGKAPELYPSGLIDYLSADPVYFAAGYGDDGDVWYDSMGAPAGWSTRTNFSYGFTKLRNEDVSGLNLSNALPRIAYRTVEAGSFSVVAIVQGRAFSVTSGAVVSNQTETVAISGTTAAAVPAARRWTQVTNVVVSGDRRGGDSLVIYYDQPVAQAGVGNSYQFLAHHYNERAKYLDALRWTFKETTASNPAAAFRRHFNFGQTCTWAQAQSLASSGFSIDSNSVTPRIHKYTSARIVATPGACVQTNGEYMWEAGWSTAWAYDYDPNLNTNIEKTVDTYFLVERVGAYNDNGLGFGATGVARRASTLLSYAGTLSNNYGDTSFGIGGWVTPLSTNAIGAITNEGVTASTIIDHITKWDFEFVLP